MGDLVRDKMGKINDTAVEVIEGMKQREREDRVVGWEVGNAVVQIFRWVSRGVWGGTLLIIFNLSVIFAS
jgi:hypothetical protein